ncbi:MAG: hypothetical protein H6923_04255 [Alphaproteobacteria bacterium]|nr:hypothetical protein [Alphaproteobacteria bacterium]
MAPAVVAATALGALALGGGFARAGAEEAAVSPIPADAKLIFSSARAGEESAIGFPAVELYAATLEGEVTRLTHSRGVHNHFTVSPDRTKIAANRYREDTDKDGRLFPIGDFKELWIIDVVNGTERKVAPEIDAGYGGIAWMPDSRHVVFGTPSDQGMDLVKLDTETGESEPLTRNLGKLLGSDDPRKFVSDVDVSPDGEWLAFLYNIPRTAENTGGVRPKTRVTVMRTDGSEARIVTDGGPLPPGKRGNWNNGDFDPDFSPDGKAVSFQRQTDVGMANPGLSTMDVMTVNIDGTGLTRISPEGNDAAHGISSWDVGGIVFTEWSDKRGNTAIVYDTQAKTFTRVPIEGQTSHVQWIPEAK